MLLDFDVQRSTRRCAATDRALEPGETCYSVLEVQGVEVVRKDYCREAWTPPPENAFGWWQSRVPEHAAKKVKLAPNEVLLELFDALAERTAEQDLRYVLTLLLIRRRVLRLDVAAEQLGLQSRRVNGENAAETMIVYCPKRDAAYEVPVAMPDQPRIDQIQQRLSDLLIAGAE